MSKRSEALTGTNGIDTFESWSAALADALRPHYAKHGYELPAKIRHLPGFTSKGKRGRIKGECWPAVASDDKTVEIFVQGDLDDPGEVSGVIVHEHIHAMLPIDAGHGKLFEKAALIIGLDTSQGLLHARPGKVLQAEVIDPILAEIGPIPRKKLNFKSFSVDGKEVLPADKAKKQTTRMLKAECKHADGCGYTVRLAQSWLKAAQYGPPMCPKHQVALVAEEKEEAE